MRRLGCLVALVGLSTALSAAVVSIPGERDRRASAAPPVDLLVGDSVMAGMGGARGTLPSHVFDARVCRRLVSPSCSYRGSTPSTALAAVQAAAGRYNRALVVAAGYNDGSIGGAVDAIVGEARRQGIRNVVWLTYRVAGRNAGTYRNHNGTLWAKAAQHPELRIADWAAASAGQGGWVASDGLHLTGSGATAMANLIATTLAGLTPPPTRCDLAAGGVPSPATSTAPRTSEPATVAMHGRPTRLIDTRAWSDGMVRKGRTLRVPVPTALRSGTLPVIVTITAVDPCGRGFLTAFACGTPLPTTSTLNATRSSATANLAIVGVGASGEICIATTVTTDVVIDIVGNLVGSGGGRLSAIDPVRLVDTREPASGELPTARGVRPAGTTTVVPVRASAAVADSDVAVSVNLTVTGTRGRGYVSVSPGPCTSRPSTSNLNHVVGETIAVAAISRIGADGTICVYNHVETHLLVDLTGTVGTTGSRIQAAQNVRLLDTRPATPQASGLTVSTTTGPADQTGAIVNLVGIGRRVGYLAARPCAAKATPSTSTLNHTTVARANLAVVATDTRTFCVYRHVPADVVVDAVAWLVP